MDGHYQVHYFPWSIIKYLLGVNPPKTTKSFLQFTECNKHFSIEIPQYECHRWISILYGKEILQQYTLLEHCFETLCRLFGDYTQYSSDFLSFWTLTRNSFVGLRCFFIKVLGNYLWQQRLSMIFCLFTLICFGFFFTELSIFNIM